jgi:hypothetical protein
MAFKKRQIGEMKVHPIGLGCMNLTPSYGPGLERSEAIDFLKKATDIGYDFFDTATIYGLGENEKLVGDALKQNRENFLIASKCVLGFKEGKRFLDGRPSTIKAACESSLKRLQTDVIDLYYMHRPDPDVPVEESVGALAELKKEGKIRMLGLSEMSAESLRRAHSEHPISAMQSEYSLMTRNPEIAVIETCSELGVTFVPFSPVGRGYLSDETILPDELHKNDLRKTFPRFSEPHLSANLSLLEKARKISSELRCTLAQLSLAWTLAQDESAIPIPGTTSLEHLSDNFESQKVELTQELLHELNEIFLPEIISGPRYSEQAQATVTTERFEFE